ncbi:MAG: glycoside hydrolase family 5 protein [Chloroflexi bacterium]|nr:glycoside hydrolase family 5 protein [Chloroflexota bacterium]
MPQLVEPPDVGQADYLHTCGNRVYDREGRAFNVVGINWFGLETAAFAPRGLVKRNWKDILNEIARNGYNTIRLPFSNEALEPRPFQRAINYDLNPDLWGLSTLELMDRIIEGAGARGLRIILDRHRPTSNEQSPLWYSQAVSEQRWIDDWTMLALRYLGDDTVVAVDLHNEPHGDATWGTGDPYTDWRLAAQRAGDAVLAVNPYLLIFVQGIADYEGDFFWWGAQLRPAARFPVVLSVPNRLVYSPRDYGPEVYDQAYFHDPTFPANLRGIWDSRWGYLHAEGTAPVVLGEFDGPSLGDDISGIWQRTLLRYLFANRIGFVVWPLDRDVWDQPGRLGGLWSVFTREQHNLAKSFLLHPDLNGFQDTIVKNNGRWSKR